jgi:hypothetical protein
VVLLLLWVLLGCQVAACARDRRVRRRQSYPAGYQKLRNSSEIAQFLINFAQFLKNYAIFDIPRDTGSVSTFAATFWQR